MKLLIFVVTNGVHHAQQSRVTLSWLKKGKLHGRRGKGAVGHLSRYVNEGERHAEKRRRKRGTKPYVLTFPSCDLLC